MLRSRRSPSLTSTVAIAGSGAMATVHRLTAEAAGRRVVAIAGDTAASVAAIATESGARACTYAELPAAADAVVVATPPAQHAAFTMQSADASVPVLVETPLARTLAEADLIVDAERAGASIVYGENLLMAPTVTRALTLLAPEGPLRFIEARALSARPERDGPPGPTWGGGVLFELGVHPIALALVLAADARPTDVLAALLPTDDGSIDDDALVRIRFDGGLEVRIEASWRHATPVWDLQASGDAVVVRADLLPTVGLERNGEPVELPAAPEGIEPHLFDLGYLDLHRAVGPDRSTPAPRAELGRRVLEVVCAAYASAAAGGPVALPFAGPRDLSPVELWRS